MSQPTNGLAGPFEVRCSAALVQGLKEMQEHAAAEGREKEFLVALREVYDRLRTDPMNFGEPLYRLPALKLLIRMASSPLLAVSFGVHESRPLVFLQTVKWSSSAE